MEQPENPAPNYFRRRLPHFQPLEKPVFVTICTKNRWILPEMVRSRILQHCLYDDGKRIHLLCAAIMPDHVHMIFDLLANEEGLSYSLRNVMGDFRKASAHSINKMLGRHGVVWQEEPMDHILRSDEQGWVKVEYVVNNPFRAGLSQRPIDYPWLWVNPDLLDQRGLPESIRDIIEKQASEQKEEKNTAEGSRATQ